MRTVVCTTLILMAGSLSHALAAEPDATSTDYFTTQVRPILARHCLKCHGPDDKARKGKLRLDLRADASKPAASGARAIVPGKPDESELIARINSDDEAEVMPPPSTKNPLTAEEKKVLTRWVAEGAEYRDHWAFIPPRETAPPRVRHETWVKNEIDRFILARLEAEGLEPAAEADRRTLIRRVSLDLIGLPPTPEETKAFLEDRSANAYEKLVDRLLTSPHYGERWARKWLDLARYADTNGYEKDRPRSIWPYRDWVINAFNTDMPFAQFTLEQIAGDMIPNASVSQRVATGFHRNTMLNEEGGIDPLEFRFYAMNDRVTTTGTAWLGLTLLCAQCHTHKYDPLPQREYYSFMALLNNADEPEIAVPTAEVSHKQAEIEAKVAALIDQLPSKFPPLTDAPPPTPKPAEAAKPAQKKAAAKKAARKAEAKAKQAVEKKATPAPVTPKAEPARPARVLLSGPDHLKKKYADWLKTETAEAVRWSILKPSKIATSGVPKLVDEGEGVVFAVGDQSKRDVYTLEYANPPLSGLTAIRLEVLPDPRLPKNGPGRIYYEGPHGDFFLSEVRILSHGHPLKIKSASSSFAGNGAAGASAAIDGDPQTGWTINGGQGREHSAVFSLEEPLKDTKNLTVELLFERYHAAGLGKFRIQGTAEPRPATARETPFEIEAVLRIAEKDRTPADRDRLFRQFLLVAPELAEARKPIDALRNSTPKPTTTLVMQERPNWNPRATFVHNRGEYLQPTEQVQPAVFSILPPLPSDAPRDRVALSRWLASPKNPLSGRVTVNRQWAAFFGTGLVRTTEDFGYQGEAPSHPELLDWLAIEFMKKGSFKTLHKLIVMSAAYRQDSRVTPELLKKDPANRLIARGPRVRLDAEVIRDQALRVSGLLSPKVGGPSVFPPQPPGVTTEGAYGALNWKVSEGEDRYRRGLYTFAKRTTPYAMFNTFDAPSGEFCLSRREVSNTPLQALMLMNDPVFEEAAQALGNKFATAPGSVEDRVVALFERCLTRAPEAEERAQLVAFLTKQIDRFKARELDPAKVAGPGDGDTVERAAWTVLARAILNLDEAVTKG